MVSTMALWSAKQTGILFGGVTDEDTGEETLVRFEFSNSLIFLIKTWQESVFWNDL